MGNPRKRVKDIEIQFYRRFRDQKLCQGASLHSIAKELSLSQPYTYNTIRRHIDEEYRQEALASVRHANRKSYAARRIRRLEQKERSEKHRVSERRRRRLVKPWIGRDTTIYQRAYRRLTRTVAQPQILSKLHVEHPDGSWTLESLTEAIKPYVEGVAFRPETVRKRLAEPYEEHARGPPFLILDGATYKLSHRPPEMRT